VIKNLFVATLVGGIFLFVGVVAHNLEPATPLFAVAVPFAFAREVLLDIRDVRGDKQAGHRTIPVVFGESRARSVVCCLLMFGSLFCPCLLRPSNANWIDRALLIVFELSTVAAILIACSRGRSSKGWLTLSIQLLLAAMLAFAVAHTRIRGWR
jgi:4-hydroxybenzoate polyprenyltransferase